MVVDVRKLSNGAGPARPVYQHAHFCVRTFHRLLAYPGYSLFLFFIIYLQMMDIILYFKIRSREPLELTSTNQTIIRLIGEQPSPNRGDVQMFDPLPVKKLMVESAVQFVRSPLAEHVETTLHFSTYFPSISANAISYFHCFLSLVSMKFFASESLFRRQLGVLIFQFRTFLDCLDGVVYRAHSHNKRYKSHYGDFGYYVDAVSDILGGTCLMVGCLLHLYKQRPARSPAVSSRSHVCASPTISDNGCEETDSIILNLEDDPSTRVQLTSSNNDPNNQLETKDRIFMTLVLFSLRYSLAAMFWDRNVRSYEELLDSRAKTLQQQALQLSILHSPLTILIFYLWRYLCALSMQDYLLFAVFIDRTWDFITRTSTIGWCTLLITIFLTELHISQVRSLFAALLSIDGERLKKQQCVPIDASFFFSSSQTI